MKKLLVFSLLLISVFYSCEKIQLSDIKPTVTLKISDGFVSENSEIGAGEQYKVGILASSEEGENLTNIIIKSNGNTIFDNGYNAPILSENVILTKSNDETEILTIIVRNKARLADSLTIIITKAEKGYGQINRYSSIIIGCNENSSIGNYYSLINNLIFSQSDAFNNQYLIDIIYFFDPAEDKNALGSPGANLSGILIGSDAPDNWSTIRTTHYTRTPIAIIDDEFNNALNDSLIIANLFTDGGRKAKNLTASQYYGFSNNENKYGIIKIENVTGQSTGTSQFSLIIQSD